MYNHEHCSLIQYKENIFKGLPGIRPYYNDTLLSNWTNHGGLSTRKCLFCIQCGTATNEHWRENKVSRNGLITPEGGIEQYATFESNRCVYGPEIKYYRYRKIIDKMIELQSTRSGLTFKQAMDQITLAGVNILLLNPRPGSNAHADITIMNKADITAEMLAQKPDNVEWVFQEDVDAVYADILKRKTLFSPRYTDEEGKFTPELLGLFKEENINVLYPADLRCKISTIPNMRNTSDVITNNLMPEIIINTRRLTTTYGESPNKLVIFNHREYTNINPHIHIDNPNWSLKDFIYQFNNYIYIFKNYI